MLDFGNLKTLLDLSHQLMEVFYMDCLLIVCL